MQHTRAGNAHTNALLSMIVLLLLTLVFGVISWMKNKEATQLSVGDEESRAESKVPLIDKQQDLADLKAKLEELEQAKNAHREELHRLDLKLASRSAYFDDAAGTWKVGGPDFKTRRQLMSAEVQRTLEIMEDRVKSRERQDPIFEPIEELISDLQEQTQQVLQDVTDMDAKLEADKEVLNQKRDDLEARMAADKKQFQNDFSERSTEISQADDQIRRLLELELRWLDELKPDGRVVQVSEERDEVMINLGENVSLRPGMRFEIFQYVRGRFVEKGMCEVIDLDMLTAKCRVIEEVDGRRNPIAKEDLIGNPIFNAARPLNFVLAGEFHEYNRRDLADFIRRTGGNVRDELQPGVDYLVAGADSEEEQDKAREYQITGMTEKQLVRYLDTTFRFESQKQ